MYILIDLKPQEMSTQRTWSHKFYHNKLIVGSLKYYMILKKEVSTWIVITTIGEHICEEPFFPITGLGGGIILVLISYQSENIWK